MSLRAAIYTRISEDVPELTRLGVQRQEEDCRELVERRGWEVSGIFEDNDVSAYSGRSRPAYRRLLGELEARMVDVVVAWHPDRLHRHPAELEEFIAVIERNGIQVETVRAGALDFGTPTGRMVARMLGATARYESEHKAERIRRKHQELAASGRSAGGGRPFGFEADRRTLRESEARLVREAAARVLAGESMRSLATDFNTRGIPTAGKAEAWTGQVLRTMLVSARISGRREMSHADGRRLRVGRITNDRAEWPAIISAADSDRLRSLLSGLQRPRVVRHDAYLLSGGIGRCGLCGASLQAGPRGDGRRQLKCLNKPGYHGCGRVSVMVEPLDELVIEAVLQAVDGGALARALEVRREDPLLEQEVATLAGRLLEVARMMAAGEIEAGEWRAMRATIEPRLADARRRLAAVHRGSGLEGLPADLRTAWPRLPVARRRAVISALVAEVRVGPGRGSAGRFNPERVEVRWRV